MGRLRACDIDDGTGAWERVLTPILWLPSQVHLLKNQCDVLWEQEEGKRFLEPRNGKLQDSNLKKKEKEKEKATPRLRPPVPRPVTSAGPGPGSRPRRHWGPRLLGGLSLGGPPHVGLQRVSGAQGRERGGRAELAPGDFPEHPGAFVDDRQD